GAARLWLDGRWQQVEVIGFEITDEPVGDVHGMQVNDWSYEGCQALRRGDGAAAASLFQKSIDFEGESPDLLNNLALAYLQQGRTGEALQLARQIHERWPDYFFGRIAMANMATAAGDYESADSYLAPLRQRRKLHTTEFTSLASANVRLLLASRNVSAARTWLAMWRQIDPEHPELERLELKCSSPGAFRALKRLLPTRRR
ncbi:MAG TPA: tetratricopeptide repeat protein, partial [Pirellulales bacterium]